MSESKIGVAAPNFTLPASAGSDKISLSDYAGKNVLLAFYILDFTGT